MSTDYSLIGYESISVAEYLPILEKIKNDLKMIYDIVVPALTLSGRLDLESVVNNLEPVESILNKTANTGMNTCDSFKTLYEETENAYGKLHQIVQDIPLNIPPENTQRNHSIDMLPLLNILENHLKEMKQLQPNTTHSGEFTTLQEELSNLRKNDKEKDDQMVEMIKRMEEYVKQMAKKDEQIEKMKTEIKNLNENVEIEKNKVDTSDKTVKSLTEELHKKEAIIKNLEGALKSKEKPSVKERDSRKPSVEIETELDLKTKRISELTQVISQLEKKLAEANTRIEELATTLKKRDSQSEATIDDNYNQLITQLQQKRLELRQRDTKIQDLENEITESEHKIRKMEREIRVLNRNLDENKLELAESEKTKGELETKYRFLSREHKSLKNNVTNDEDIEKYLNEINSMKNSIAAKNTEIRDLSKVVEQMKEDSKNLSDSKDALKNQLKSLETLKKELESKTKECEDQANTIRDNKEELTRKQKAIENMRMKIKSSAEPAVEAIELKKLQHQLRNKEMEYEQLQNKVKNLDQSYDKLYKENEATLKKNKQITMELDGLRRLQLKQTKAPENKESGNNNAKDQFPDWWKKHMIQ